MANFLFELLSEEIPARMQLQAAQDLKKLFSQYLTIQGLDYSDVTTFVTPRRLVAIVEGLVTETKETTEERRGPKLTAPEKALEGFLTSVKVSFDQCEKRDGYLFARIKTPSRKTVDVLPEVIRQIIRSFSWAKSMRWPGATLPWVRPVRSVLALFDNQPCSFFLEEFGLESGHVTYGHFSLKPEKISISSIEDYKESLEKSYVILDHQERQKIILEDLKRLAQEKEYILEEDNALLQEVAGLTEYPIPQLGKIDPAFMMLPKPVLSTSMKVHQRYFTFLDKDGSIAPIFGFIANTIPSDDGKLMRQGYERVLQARLSDAQFFYEQDLKTPLGDHIVKLSKIIFQEKLGSLGQKVERLQEAASSQETKRAAFLCKADLVTNMVGEFPELQGVMGECYAKKQGESSTISKAIRQHYQPQGPNDSCPNESTSVELALLDKLDTLVGFFGIGEIPTGSKDPFALRRAALGIIRLIRENNRSDLDLKSLIDKIIRLYHHQGIKLNPSFEPQTIIDFILDRLSQTLRNESIRHDCIAAVFATQLPHAPINIWSLAERTIALTTFLNSEEGQSLQAAFRRANGILTKENQIFQEKQIDVRTFKEPCEIQLYGKIEDVAKKSPTLLLHHQYQELMHELAQLREPLDVFFTLRINDEDSAVRHNRLELLGYMVQQTAIIADFRKLEG